MAIGKHVALGVSSAVALAAAMAFADETAYITSSGSVTVSSGRTVATPKTMQFYRFTITDKYYPGGYDNYNDWKGNTEVGEIALYDAEGNRLNANLTLNKDENGDYTFAAATASASSLAAGTFSVTVPTNVPSLNFGSSGISVGHFVL